MNFTPVSICANKVVDCYNVNSNHIIINMLLSLVVLSIEVMILVVGVVVAAAAAQQ